MFKALRLAETVVSSSTGSLPHVRRNHFSSLPITLVSRYQDYIADNVASSLARLRIDKYSEVIVSVPRNNSHFSLSKILAICLKRIVSIFSVTSHSSFRAFISLIACSSFMMRVSILDTSEKLLSLVFQDLRLLDFIVSMSQRCIVSFLSLSSSSFAVKNAIWLRSTIISDV